MPRIKLVLLISIAFLLVFNSNVSAQSENTCVNCHKSSGTISSMEEWQQGFFSDWERALHSEKGVTCDKCHGGDPTKNEKTMSHEGIKDSSNPESLTFYKNIPKTCGNCHADVLKEFQKSVMFHNLESDKLAPTCVTCMGSHDVGIVDAVEVPEKCGNCHNEIMGVRPEIPLEAKRLLLLQEHVKNDIITAEITVQEAKGMGKDVYAAEVALEDAVKIIQKSGNSWHRFRLTQFEGELLDASFYGHKANNLAYELIKKEKSTSTTPPPDSEKGICGPITVLLLAMLPPVFYSFKRKR